MRNKWDENAVLATPRRAVCVVMLEITELKLKPGARAYETEALSSVLNLPVVLDLLTKYVTHTDLDSVAPHEMIPNMFNDWHGGTHWTELAPIPRQTHTY